VDARDVRQIGYYRVTGSTDEESSNSWDLAWNGRYVYLWDMNRGIEALALKSSTKAAAVSRLQTVRAPAAQADPYAPVPTGSLSNGALICPGFKSR
jgi:hypothetical protein